MRQHFDGKLQHLLILQFLQYHFQFHFFLRGNRKKGYLKQERGKKRQKKKRKKNPSGSAFCGLSDILTVNRADPGYATNLSRSHLHRGPIPIISSQEQAADLYLRHRLRSDAVVAYLTARCPFNASRAKPTVPRRHDFKINATARINGACAI